MTESLEDPAPTWPGERLTLRSGAMPPVFVIPASSKLTEAVAKVRPVIDGDPSITRPLCKAVGIAYVDDIVDGMVLGYIRESASASARTKSLVETLAKMIKSVAHGLVGQAFGRLTPESAKQVLAYIDERSAPYHGDHGLGVPIETATADGIRTAQGSLESEDLASRRAVLKSTMHGVIERAMEYHYQKPFAMLDMGFLTRKAVDVGYDTILRGSRSTIETAIDDAGPAQLGELTTFLARRLVA